MPTSSSSSESSDSLDSSGSDDSSDSSDSSESSDDSSDSSSSSSCYPSWELRTVSFAGAGYHAVKKDGTDNPYESPHWTAEAVPGSSDPNPRKYPVLYVAGAKMSLSASWQMDPADGCESTFEVKADCPDGIKLAATTATLSNDGILSIAPTEVDTAFPSSRVDRFDPMTITWYISVDGGEWEEAGTSENPVYVCLKAPIGDELYRTVVHLACTIDSPTDEDQAVGVTWEQFQGPANVKTWDDQPLYYYKANTTISQNVTTAKDLLSSTLHTGQCTAWANLFRLALKVNGITADRILVRSTDTDLDGVHHAIVVKEWSFSNTPYYGGTPTLWKFVFLTLSNDMTIGHMAGNLVYGDLTNGTGLLGQNAPTPSQKFFGQHVIVKCKDQYFDPSYGVTYTGEGDFQNKAISGFGIIDKINTPPPGENWWKIYKPDQTVKIKFTNHGSP